MWTGSYRETTQPGPKLYRLYRPSRALIVPRHVVGDAVAAQTSIFTATGSSQQFGCCNLELLEIPYTFQRQPHIDHSIITQMECNKGMCHGGQIRFLQDQKQLPNYFKLCKQSPGHHRSWTFRVRLKQFNHGNNQLRDSGFSITGYAPTEAGKVQLMYFGCWYQLLAI